MSSARLTTITPIAILSVALSVLHVPSAAGHGTASATIGCPGTSPTLASAIASANTNNKADILTLTAGCRYNVTATLVVGPDNASLHAHTLTILGHGATIDGGGTVGVFNVQAKAILTLDRVNVAHGQASIGGGILNEGTLALDHSNVLASSADLGGGIFNVGRLALTNANVMGCIASADGGGIYTKGGSVAVKELSNVSENQAAGEGGGIHNLNGQVDVDSSRLADNNAGQSGGAMANRGSARFTASFVSDNDSTGDGGGISNFATASLTDSFVSDNRATLSGGGIYNAGKVALGNSNVSNNRADTGGGVFNSSGSGRPALSLSGSAVSHNRADPNRGGGIYNSGGDVTAKDSSVSHNVAVSDGGGIYSVPNGTLGAIVDFRTSRLTNNSAGQNSGGGGMHNRGEAKFSGSTISDNVAQNGGGFLNEGKLTISKSALANNEAQRGGGVLNDAAMTIKSTAVSNNKADDAGGGIFNSDDTTVLDSTLDENRALGHGGGGIYNDGTIHPNGGQLRVTDTAVTTNRAEAGSGGGIHNFGGAVSMNGTNPKDPPRSSRLSRNRASLGGGIFNTFGGSVKLTKTAVSSNRALDGGGILNTDSGIVSLLRSEVSYNRATGSGGGILNEDRGNLFVRMTTLAENIAIKDHGGAIWHGGDQVALASSTVSGNAAGSGGGVYTEAQGGLTVLGIFNSTLSDNSARDVGGGVYVRSQATVEVSWTTLLGNDNGPSGSPDGGSLYNHSGTVTIEHSIVASSRGTYQPLPAINGSSCFGTIQGSNNLTNTASCGSPFALGAPGLETPLRVNANPDLTKTHALLPFSDALAMGTGCPAADQRGFPRPSGSCDVGSFEFQ